MIKELFDYDDRSIDSIFEYAKQLEGMSFRDILVEYQKSPLGKYINRYESSNNADIISKDGRVITNQNAKGQLGNLLEKYYFGYELNSNQAADFPKVGMELKQTPIDVRKDGALKAGERLSITNISYDEPVEDDFYKSHVWDKIKLILLIQYIRDKKIPNLDYVIKFVNLFSPPEEDLKIIIDDYFAIIKKIKEGRAHELSEGDTFYLGACTKGATAESSYRPQYYGDHKLAKKRNFCFKSSYMDYVLQNYVLSGNMPGESILKGLKLSHSFEEHIIGLIDVHKGQTDYELCQMYGREYNNNKAQWVDLSYRMLGIKGNHAEEFMKAGVVVKAIRVESDGKINESMSFAPVSFKELADETWEESSVYEYFESRKFLFVVFKQNDSFYELRGAQLWNMPYADLNIIVRDEWEGIVKVIREGVAFEIRGSATHPIVTNNIPGLKDNRILHMRPHAQKAAYSLRSGFVWGNVDRDADELPNGDYMTRQSFWLNRSYIMDQIKVK